MILNCAIIDDEPLALELLTNYVKKTPFLNLTGGYNSAIAAIKDLKSNPVDVIFLDIQMPELSGLEFATILPKETKIIFTTAFNQYAMEGYKVDALYYLLKPISYEDFLKAANKALDWFTMVRKTETYKRDGFIFVKSDYKLVRISLHDVLFIEGLKDYVRFYMPNDEKILSLMNMKKLEEYLPKPDFLRVHRSYIVNMNKVVMVDRSRIVFGEFRIPISESYKDTVQAYFDRHTMS